MYDYFSLIFVGFEQLITISSAVILWILLSAIGRLFNNKEEFAELNVIIGWAVVSAVFTIIGIFINQSFYTLSGLLLTVSLFSLYGASKHRKAIFVPGTWRILILAIPILLIVSAMQPSQWDEFSHWLPASKYLFKYNGFPNNEIPDLGSSMFPGYPFAWPFLTYLGSLIAGKFIDNIPGILNFFLIMTFAVFALRTGLRVIGRELEPRISWFFASVVILVSTIFNPTFIQKIIFTAYSDSSTSVIVGFSLLMGFYFINNLNKEGFKNGSAHAWQLGLLLALLINIRQTNLVFVVIILFAVTLLAIRDPNIRLELYLKNFIKILVLPLIVYLSWRYHVINGLGQIADVEATLKPLKSWNIEEIPLIIKQMSYVAFKKIAFFTPMLIACYFGIQGLLRYRTLFHKISILIGVSFLAYTSFLFLMYVASFTHTQAITAVSFWRYSTHNGMAAIAFIVIGGIISLNHFGFFERRSTGYLWLPIVFVLIMPLLFSYKIRFDLEMPKPHFTAVARDINSFFPENGNILIVDPKGTGESYKITNYYLEFHRPDYIAAFTSPTLSKISKKLKDEKDKSYVLIHSVVPGLSQLFGKKLLSKKSYLFQKRGSGWEVVKDWEKPDNYKN